MIDQRLTKTVNFVSFYNQNHIFEDSREFQCNSMTKVTSKNLVNPNWYFATFVFDCEDVDEVIIS